MISDEEVEKVEFYVCFSEVSNCYVIPTEFGYGKRTYLAMAILDTGAQKTAISEKFVKKHHLAAINTGEQAASASGLSDYIVLKSKPDIRIGNMVFEKMDIDVAPMVDSSVDLIIGLDIILKGDYSLKSTNGTSELTFSVPDETPGVSKKVGPVFGHPDYIDQRRKKPMLV